MPGSRIASFWLSALPPRTETPTCPSATRNMEEVVSPSWTTIFHGWTLRSKSATTS
jgi:hypothetical protein